MADDRGPSCLTQRCGRRTRPGELLCDPCFRRRDRSERAGYSVLTRLVDDDLAPVELERIHRAGWRAVTLKTSGR